LARPVDREQLFAQKVAEKTVQLVLAVFQTADQRELTVAELNHEIGQRLVLKELGQTILVNRAEERGLTKKSLFVRRARGVKLLRQGVESFTAGGILPIDVGKPLAERRAKLQQRGRVLGNQFVPIVSSKPPENGIFDRLNRRRTRLAREQSHFTEPIARPEDGDDFRFARAAFQNDLHRP
jgi:hypothetical protein